MALNRTTAGLLAKDDFNRPDSVGSGTPIGGDWTETAGQLFRVLDEKLECGPVQGSVQECELTSVSAGEMFVQSGLQAAVTDAVPYICARYRGAGATRQGYSLRIKYHTNAGSRSINLFGWNGSGGTISIDGGANSIVDQDMGVAQLYVADGVQEAHFETSTGATETLSGTDTTWDGDNDQRAGAMSQSHFGSGNTQRWDDFIVMRGKTFVATGLSSGQKLKIFDSGDTEIFSATESSGTATISASKFDGATVDVPVDGWAYATITDSGDNELARFDTDPVYPGDVYEFTGEDNPKPSQPVVTITNVTATGVSAITSAFDPGSSGASHEGTDWKITRISDGVVVYNPGLDTTNKTSIANAGSSVPLDTENELYKLEARHGEEEST